MFILYCHMSMIEDYMLAREINRVSGKVYSAFEERSHSLQELDTLAEPPVVEKMVDFLKEIQRKDKERVLQLQISRRETRLRACEKDLFIKKLKGVQGYKNHYSEPERFTHRTKKKKKTRNPFIPVEDGIPKVKYPPFENLFEALVVYNPFLDLPFPMADDQPMWGNNRAVAPTLGAVILTVDLGDTFTIKGHHLSMIKDHQFDEHAWADSRNNDSKLMEKMEALTTKIDSQFKEIKGEMKEMRDGCNSCGGPHPSLECDDKPMGGPKDEEANYAYGGYRGE
nr:reverse transcriptase domain-containing protein [Tanacetum cinerariifolium]